MKGFLPSSLLTIRITFCVRPWLTICTLDRYALFDYKYSGIQGDHSLTCKISIGSDNVIWYDFKNFFKILLFDLNYTDIKFRFFFNQIRMQ
ncbi:hypothetical protein ACR78F_07275 [Sphingobacterium spiritivorum]